MIIGGAVAAGKFAIFRGVMVIAMIIGTRDGVIGKPMEQRLVRIAELKIDADQLPAYTAALKEEISKTLRLSVLRSALRRSAARFFDALEPRI